MKCLGKLWVVFEILALIITFINPYIGIFAMFTAIEFLILGVVAINIRARKKSENSVTINSRKAQKFFGIILTIFFFVIKNLVNTAACILGSEQGKTALPFNLLTDNVQFSFVLLLITVAINIICAVSFIIKVRED